MSGVITQEAAASSRPAYLDTLSDQQELLAREAKCAAWLRALALHNTVELLALTSDPDEDDGPYERGYDKAA